VERWAGFGESQLFSEQTQILRIFTVKLDYSLQPIADGWAENY